MTHTLSPKFYFERGKTQRDRGHGPSEPGIRAIGARGRTSSGDGFQVGELHGPEWSWESSRPAGMLPPTRCAGLLRQ